MPFSWGLDLTTNNILPASTTAVPQRPEVQRKRLDRKGKGGGGTPLDANSPAEDAVQNALPAVSVAVPVHDSNAALELGFVVPFRF